MAWKSAAQTPQSELVLSHPDSDQKITLAVTPTCAGIWIGDKDDKGSLIAIYKEKTDQQVAIGIYGKGDDKTKGLNIALTVGEDGSPFVQLVDKDGYALSLSFADLKAIASK